MLFVSLFLQVPSLYVRVYRLYICQWHQGRGSLTIREGISLVPAVVMMHSRFPHYTWGYIIQVIRESYNRGVPSLYVRVYRLLPVIVSALWCSLTIREGISEKKQLQQQNAEFPHYTWGYIDRRKNRWFLENVPSLYVRVYRFFTNYSTF